MLISPTKIRRKSCVKAADFLRKVEGERCAKPCGKAVEKWRISGGTLAEKG
jgi:hypothetical protein